MSKQSTTITLNRTAELAEQLRVVLGRLRRRLRGQTRLGDLNWSQISVLGLLEREGAATISALARSEGMRSQSMGAMIAALETDGLVSGKPDPNDGRQTLWNITAAGQSLIKEGRAARADWLSHAIQDNLSPTEQDQLADALELLKRIADS